MKAVQEAIPREIAIAVVESEGEYLVALRPPGVPLAGYWEFPGGKIESGETAASAAIRECAEETGLAVRCLAELLIHEEHYDHGGVRLHFMSCEPISSARSTDPPWRWVSRRDVLLLRFPSGNLPLLQRIRAESEC